MIVLYWVEGVGFRGVEGVQGYFWRQFAYSYYPYSPIGDSLLILITLIPPHNLIKPEQFTRTL